MPQDEMESKTDKFFAGLTLVTAVVFSLIHLYTAGVRFFPPYYQRPLHLAGVFLLLYLIYPVRQKYKGKAHWTKWIDLSLGIAGVLCCVYVMTNFMTLALRMGRLRTVDIVVAAALVVLVLEGCRRLMGWPLVIVALVFLAYVFWGDRLPRAIATSGFSFQRSIQQISLGLDGIFGTALGVSATQVAPFIIFGCFLEASGAGQAFIDLTMSLFGRYRGGPAKSTVGAAALFGMISGSQVANVAATGVFTIPMMKNMGYPKEFAGGISAAASTGGMLTPPVLGAAAFLISDMLGVPYSEVVIATIVPAFLYYVALFMMVDMRASKLNFRGQPREELPDFRKTLKDGGHLLLPIVVLVFNLFYLRLTPGRSAFWATVSVPVCGLLRRSTWMSFKSIIGALENGAKTTLLIGVACATAGIVMGVVFQTGLALRLTGWMVMIAGDSLLVLLLLSMVSSIILGMGLPPVAAYLLLAIMGAPALVRMGVEPMAAHVFIFFFGTLSSITPPVANAAFAAGALAKADPMRTGFEACRLALAAFIVPFMFVYGNELLLIGTPMNILIAVITATIGVIALAGSLEGYFFIARINVVERTALFIAALLCCMVGIITDLIGLAIVVAVFMFEHKKKQHMAVS